MDDVLFISIAHGGADKQSLFFIMESEAFITTRVSTQQKLFAPEEMV